MSNESNRKEIWKKLEVMEIGSDLKSMQEFVGGYIEVPFVSPNLRDRNIIMVVNEEAVLQGLEPTLALVRNGQVVGCLQGQLFFCSTDGEDFAELNEEQIQYIIDNTVFDGADNDKGLTVDVLYI